MTLRILIPAFLLAAATGCGTGGRSTPAPPQWIRTAFPEVRTSAESYPLSGTVVPQAAPQLVSFLVAGRVERADLREGEPVRKGQFLAALESSSYAAGLEAAQAQTHAAEAAAARAQDECQRMKLLFDRQSLAENDYLKFKLAEQAARDQFLQARANEKIARKTMADAVLRAPANGVVTRRLVEPGLTVGTGQPVYEISQMEPMEVQVGVPETLLGTLRIGQAATLTLPALPLVHLAGTLRVLNASADPASRTFMARIAVNNPGKALRPGMVAEARIQGDQTRPMLYLPLEAVTKDAQGATIVFEFSPSERRVYSRRVTLGTLAGERVQVQAGLDANTPVVVAGQHRLRDGCPVQIETAAGRN